MKNVAFTLPAKVVDGLRAYSAKHDITQNRIILAALLQAGVIEEGDLVTTKTIEVPQLPKAG